MLFLPTCATQEQSCHPNGSLTKPYRAFWQTQPRAPTTLGKNNNKIQRHQRPSNCVIAQYRKSEQNPFPVGYQSHFFTKHGKWTSSTLTVHFNCARCIPPLDNVNSYDETMKKSHGDIISFQVYTEWNAFGIMREGSLCTSLICTSISDFFMGHIAVCRTRISPEHVHPVKSSAH